MKAQDAIRTTLTSSQHILGMFLSDLSDAFLHSACGNQPLGFGQTYLGELGVQPGTCRRIQGDRQLRPLDPQLDWIQRIARQTAPGRGCGGQSTDQERDRRSQASFGGYNIPGKFDHPVRI